MNTRPLLAKERGLGCQGASFGSSIFGNGEADSCLFERGHTVPPRDSRPPLEWSLVNLHLTNDPTLDLILVVAFTAMVATYFVPTMIAYIRQHERRAAILLVDLFLGWTFVGWSRCGLVF